MKYTHTQGAPSTSFITMNTAIDAVAGRKDQATSPTADQKAMLQTTHAHFEVMLLGM